MRIGIDISQAVYETGVSKYTKNLVEHLLKIDKDNEYLLYAGSLRRRKEIMAYLETLTGNVKSKVSFISPNTADIIWNRLHILRIENIVGNLDVFHSSDWSQPPTNAFNVTTVHDLVPLLYPQYSDPKILSVHKSKLSWVAKEADRIIVPSNSTEDDLVKYGVKKERIRVIPEAPVIYEPKSGQRSFLNIKKKYNINKPYILSIGITPRKNIDRIIKAYEKVKTTLDINLVIAGHDYLKINPPRGVRILGHVPDGELHLLLKGSKALVYPSLYEGFGIPILNAFVYKVPVVTSKIGSMKEIAEEGAYLADPYDFMDIARGIESVFQNKNMYIKKGLKIVKKYSWENTARLTLNVYKEVKT